MAVSDEETVRVVGCGQRWPLRFNDGFLSGGKNEPFRPRGRGAEECERVDIAVALTRNCAIECGGFVGSLAPETDCLVAGGRENRVRSGEANRADLIAVI